MYVLIEIMLKITFQLPLSCKWTKKLKTSCFTALQTGQWLQMRALQNGQWLQIVALQIRQQLQIKFNGDFAQFGVT